MIIELKGIRTFHSQQILPLPPLQVRPLNCTCSVFRVSSCCKFLPLSPLRVSASPLSVRHYFFNSLPCHKGIVIAGAKQPVYNLSGKKNDLVLIILIFFRFDTDSQRFKEELNHERTLKEKISREKDKAVTEKFQLEHELSVCWLCDVFT